MKLTENHKYIIKHYETSKVREIAVDLGLTHSAVSKQIAALKAKGYITLQKRNKTVVDTTLVSEVVAELQEFYPKVGESQQFKNAVTRARKKLGLKKANEFCSAVKTEMRQKGKQGKYSDYIRGFLDKKLTPLKVLSQRWDREFCL